MEGSKKGRTPVEKITLWILLMSVITFGVRYAFFARVLTIQLNRHTKQFLVFTGPCILTAMWTPIAFVDALTTVDIVNPYVLASLFTIVASRCIRHTLLVILLSMAVFYALRMVL